MEILEGVTGESVAWGLFALGLLWTARGNPQGDLRLRRHLFFLGLWGIGAALLWL